MENKIEIKTSEGVTDVMVRHGEAAKIYDPVAVKISGQITAPRSWFDPRVGQSKPNNTPYFGIQETHVLSNRYSGTIVLIHGENEHFRTEITGTLDVSPEYKELGINSGKSYTPQELGNKLREMRYLFPDKEQGMKLVTELKNFTATVSASVEDKKDTRGSKKSLLDVSVESNIPLEIMLKIPVFKGFAPIDLKVEIVLDSRGHAVDCYLESPEATQIIKTERDQIFDLQLAAFSEYGLSIIEI